MDIIITVLAVVVSLVVGSALSLVVRSMWNRGKLEASKQQARQILEDSEEPVSYTHLTLPTILLV